MTQPSVAPIDLPGAPGHSDVVVVGAGVTGLTTALLLLEAGRSVTVLEQDVPGALASGRNTGKASVLQGSRLSTIRAHHPARLVRAYVDANLAGQRWLRAFCESAGVGVREATAYSYAQSMTGLDAVDDEVRAAREAGLPVRRVDDVVDDVPFPIAGAAALDRQLALDPAELVRALAAAVAEAGGTIVTGVRALGVRAAKPAVVRTSAGDLTADQVVIATATPVLDRGLTFAKVSGFRSVLVSFAAPSRLPQGLYLSVDAPTRSIRTAHWGGETRLIVGGGDRPVGREASARELVDGIVGWTAAWFPDASDPVSWAAQDYESHNRIPFVGRMPRGRGRVWFATGYAKWGLTNGVSAALRISSEILGDARPDWARVIGSRFTVPADIMRGVTENAKVGAAAARGWVDALRSEPAEVASAPGEGVGTVVRSGIRPVGVSTVGGDTCAVSAVCPHLGGVLHWNDAELTWDCPLHASRFDHRGRRIEGPAVHDLTPVPEAAPPAVGPAAAAPPGQAARATSHPVE